MKTYEADPDELMFLDASDKEKVIKIRKILNPVAMAVSKHRFENIGRNRPDPWFFYSGWTVSSEEQLCSVYPRCISHKYTSH